MEEDDQLQEGGKSGDLDTTIFCGRWPPVLRRMGALAQHQREARSAKATRYTPRWPGERIRANLLASAIAPGSRVNAVELITRRQGASCFKTPFLM